MDVSLANLVTLSTTATPSLVSSAMNSPTSHVYIPSLASAVPQAASAFAITPVPPAPASMVSSPVPMVLGSTVGSIPQPGGFANRSLHAILEAIRHLEGNAAFASSSPPPQPATSHANLLVRWHHPLRGRQPAVDVSGSHPGAASRKSIRILVV